MTLPFYDELLDKEPPRVCGAAIFSRFMKSPVVCKSVSTTPVHRYNKHSECVEASFTKTSNSYTPSTNNPATTPSAQSLPSTTSSDSSLRRPGSPRTRSRPPQNSDEDDRQSKNNRTRARSCMPLPVVGAGSSLNPTKYQQFSKVGVSSRILDENLAGIKTSPNRDIRGEHETEMPQDSGSISILAESKSPSAVARRSLEMDKLFEQHVPSQNVIQFDPYMNNGSQNNSNSGVISPFTALSELSSDLELTSSLVARTKDVEDLNDNDDTMWDVLYATKFASHEQRQPAESAVRQDSNIREDTAEPSGGFVSTSIMDELAEQRESYKLEAKILREEMERCRIELECFKNILPNLQQHQESWEEVEDVWKKIGNFEFAQSFSSKGTTEDIFMQNAENYFQKDWDFSFLGRERNEEIERGINGQQYSAGELSEQQTKAMKVFVHQCRQRPSDSWIKAHQNDNMPGEETKAVESDVSGQTRRRVERPRVSFKSPEVSEESKYYQSCMTTSSEPNVAEHPRPVHRWTNAKTSSQSSQVTEELGMMEESRLDYEPGHLEGGGSVFSPWSRDEKKDDHSHVYHNITNRTRGQKNEPNLDSDRSNYDTTQTEENNFKPEYENNVYGAPSLDADDDGYQLYLQGQELEVIPEVDEGEFSNNHGEYAKDMAAVKKLLKKYGKKASFQADRESCSVEKETPLVQIENIDAVIEYRDARDPADFWFERHASLSLDRDERDSMRSKRISLTVGLSPNSESSREKGRRRYFGEGSNKQNVPSKSPRSDSRIDSGTVVSSMGTKKNPTRSVGKISKETLKHWETQKW